MRCLGEVFDLLLSVESDLHGRGVLLVIVLVDLGADDVAVTGIHDLGVALLLVGGLPLLAVDIEAELVEGRAISLDDLDLELGSTIASLVLQLLLAIVRGALDLHGSKLAVDRLAVQLDLRLAQVRVLIRGIRRGRGLVRLRGIHRVADLLGRGASGVARLLGGVVDRLFARITTGRHTLQYSWGSDGSGHPLQNIAPSGVSHKTTLTKFSLSLRNHIGNQQ